MDEEASCKPYLRKTGGGFTPQNFSNFLLNTIFTELLFCDSYPDRLHASRTLLTAVGKLQEDWYLVQVSSEDQCFENARILQLNPNLLLKLGALL
jgi:hypothetical protein